LRPLLLFVFGGFLPPAPPYPLTQCKKEAKGLELVSIAEYDVCKYRMILALPQWCNVKD
jgi:hypothetical protein